jgi:hypothetical protein
MLHALSRADEAGMSSIHQNLGRASLGYVAIKVAGIQHACQLGSSILRVWSKIGVELIQTLKLDVTRCTLMSIRGLVHNPHSTVLLGSLLEKLKEVSCQKDMAQVVRGHVLINTIRRKLISLNTPPSIVNKNIKTISRVLDSIGSLLDFSPVTQIALDPFRAVSLLLSEFFSDGLLGALDDFLGQGKDEELADIVGEEGVSNAVANTFASSCHDGDFARQAGGFREGELVGGKLFSGTTKVLGNGVLKRLMMRSGNRLLGSLP